MSDKDTKNLQRLLEYLKKASWYLSCWYKGIYPDKIQERWKKHWLDEVIPHFDWEEIAVIEDKDVGSVCQMCGYKGIKYVSWVFHPAFRVSSKFLAFNEIDQAKKEREEGYSLQTYYGDLPPVLQKKRLHSLCVGSECVKILTASKEEVDEWLQKKEADNLEKKKSNLTFWADQYNTLDDIDPDLKKKKNNKRKNQNSGDKF